MLRTPNSELRTPNSELRTPNSELRTLFPLLPTSGWYPTVAARHCVQWVGAKAAGFQTVCQPAGFRPASAAGQGYPGLWRFRPPGLPAAHGLAHAVKLTALRPFSFKSTIWNLMRRSLNQRCAFLVSKLLLVPKSGCSCVFFPHQSACGTSWLDATMLLTHTPFLTRINPMMHLSRSTPFTNR